MTESERFQEIEYAFHVRAFGEEWARINFLPPEERRRAYAEIMDNARRKGWVPDRASRHSDAK